MALWPLQFGRRNGLLVILLSPKGAMKTGQRTLRVAFTARGAHWRETDGYNSVVRPTQNQPVGDDFCHPFIPGQVMLRTNWAYHIGELILHALLDCYLSKFEDSKILTLGSLSL